MNRLAHCLLALASFIASLEAVSREAEPLEPDCPAIAPCAGPEFVALPPDGSESATNAIPPPTARMETASGTTAGALPPFVDDTSTPRPHYLPQRRAATHPDDDGWLAATAPSPPSLDCMYETNEPVRRPSLSRRAAAMLQSHEGWMYTPTQAPRRTPASSPAPNVA
jgi:hypothetical protein